MSKIFLSYRRDDSRSITGRIYDRLNKQLPGIETFKDTQSIPTGVDFLKHTQDNLSKADIFIPVIGPGWANSLKERENDEHDYVRIEVQQALEKGMTILPLLVEGAKMPRPAEVPKSIEKICLKNALPIRPDPDFDGDIHKLISVLRDKLSIKSKPKTAAGPGKILRLGLMALGLILIFLIGKAFWGGEEEVKVNKIDCKNQKIAGVIANFSETAVDPFANTILTLMEDSLDEQYVTLRSSEYLARNIERYRDQVKLRYFSNCDTTGLFINGFRDPASKTSNVYSTLVNFPIKLPDYLRDSLTLVFPDSINFETEEDAGYIARVMSLILRSAYDDPSQIIKESYQIQEDYEITEESESGRKGKSSLGSIYLVRAQAYSIDGNDKRAKQYYRESRKYGGPEIDRVANLNERSVDEIVSIMEADTELSNYRNYKIAEHQRIETKFEKVMKNVGKSVEKGVIKLIDKIKGM